jgi:hypothetical protein
LHEGIPHAIQNITQKRKNRGKIIGTMSWLGFDILTIVQGMYWGRDKIIGWFKNNPPSEPDKLEQFNRVVGNLSLLWDALLWIAFGLAFFLVWTVLSFWHNRGKKDFLAARMVNSLHWYRAPIVLGNAGKSPMDALHSTLATATRTDSRALGDDTYERYELSPCLPD